MITVDNRCSKCAADGKDIYRMVGYCGNCHTKPVLVLHSAGHEALGPANEPCPLCGNRSVRSERLATPDEIPEAQ